MNAEDGSACKAAISRTFPYRSIASAALKMKLQSVGAASGCEANVELHGGAE